MSERNFKKKNRNEIKRQRKPVMIITAEGRNRTEQLYFSSFQSQHGKYSLKFVKAGSATDPVGMLKSLEDYWVRNELSGQNGDKAYIVLDLDGNQHKREVINQLQKESEYIELIVSNPCIEVWFLLHYNYSTHQFKNSKEPKKELAKYINGYTESMDISKTLLPYIKEANRRVDQLKEHYTNIGVEWDSAECNPMTDIPVILRELEVL